MAPPERTPAHAPGPDVRLMGMGGRNMAAEGVHSVAATSQFVAFKELRAKLGDPGVERRTARAVLATARTG